MERNAMENILKEQSFQKTGTCDEASCLVEVGQVLGVDRMIAGTVGKIGQFYTLSLRMINVATGQIMFTVDHDYDGDIKELLTSVLATAAKKLASNAGGDLKKISLIGKVGDLYITTEPAGAQVEIDEKILNGTTPLTILKLPAGEHRIVVRKNEYYGSENISLSPDDLLKVNIPMEHGSGALKIFSEPAGAEIYIDNELKGSTPCKIDNIPAGEHRISILKKNFLAQSELIKVEINAITEYSYNLLPAASITILAANQSAQIFINDEKIGQGSVSDFSVLAGDIKITVTAPDCETFSKVMKLESGAIDTVRVDLVSTLGTVAINSTPEDATLYFNEKNVGKTPYKNVSVQPGKYLLKLMKNSYDPLIDSIIVSKNASSEKSYNLKHTASYLDSIKIVKAARKKRVQMIRRIAFGSCSLIALGCGLFYNFTANEALKQYNDYKGYDASVHDENWNNYTSKLGPRNICYGAAAVFCIGLGVSIPF